jgi:glycosyltransferase involved in cell wall biosynthesis
MRYSQTDAFNADRKKLLFLACYFPPAALISCIRSWNIAKHLTRLGWAVTVVTPDPAVWRRVEGLKELDRNLKLEGIARILTPHDWRCLSPEELVYWDAALGRLAGGICRKVARRFGLAREIGWIKPAMRACRSLTENDVDVILATGPPFPSFRLANQLSRKLRKPFVLDYRDPWHNGPYGILPAKNGEEEKLLEACAAATIVSHSWASNLESRFKLGSKLHVIPNGFDPEDLKSVNPYPFDHFAIVYTGSFNPPKRVITPLMAALKMLAQSQKGDWMLHYYGEHNGHVAREAAEWNLTDRIRLHGRVSRAEALSAVRGAGLAVVITSISEVPSKADDGMITGKIFEAIGLGAPALVIAPETSDIRSVVETAGRGICLPASNVAGIAAFIQQALSDQLPASGNLGLYSWPSIGIKLDGVLRSAAGFAEDRLASATMDCGMLDRKENSLDFVQESLKGI